MMMTFQLTLRKWHIGYDAYTYAAFYHAL